MALPLYHIFIFWRDQRTKTDIRLYPNGTISYRELRNYTFDRTKSSNDETFRITTINVVYMVDKINEKQNTI
jgi:hypothetical protein